MPNRVSLSDDHLPDYVKKQSGQIVLLSDFVPSDQYEIDGFKIIPHHRASVRHKNYEMFFDSLVLEFDNKNLDELGKWVLFHAFVVASWITLPSYEDAIAGEVTVSSDPCAKSEDFSKITNRVYFWHKPAGLDLNYSELYERFIKSDDETLDMVKNIMTHLNPISHSSIRRLTDASYWQLLVYYSVIESLIGQQPQCSSRPTCSDCKKEISHNSMPALDWIKKRVGELTDNADSCEQYIEYIWGVRQKIRHKTAHASAHPTAKHVLQSKRHVVYDLKKSIGDYDRNSTALLALVNGIHDIARCLLLSHIFGLKVFPSIGPLQSVRLAPGIK